MSLRKTFLYIVSQQLSVKLALLSALGGIVAAFASLYLTRMHFLSSVIAMLVAVVFSALSARESLDAARKLKQREQENDRRVNPDRRGHEDHVLTSR